ncbi:MAG: HAD-IB family hydrolase [Patescibacteria group bacterium]|nr:HAD-IB family hydrolase [Patescibacteria group bacterium]
MKKLAIFDIDGTIFRSSLLIELTDALIREGIFPASVAEEYNKAHSKWLNREGSYDDYIMAVVRAFESKIKGVSKADFTRVARSVVKANGKRVYRYTRGLVGDLQKKGYYLLAISHSPLDIVAPFAKTLGFDKVYGRIHETDAKGKFTGKTEYLDLISDKAKILTRAVAKENLTLKSSIGVGDSEGDISFLKLVEQPICFNPNSKLYATAKRLGWKVVVERKDVVYTNINAKCMMHNAKQKTNTTDGCVCFKYSDKSQPCQLRDEEELYEEVKKIAKKHKKISASLIQKHLYIGFAQTCRLMNRLEEDGIIGKI